MNKLQPYLWRNCSFCLVIFQIFILRTKMVRFTIILRNSQQMAALVLSHSAGKMQSNNENLYIKFNCNERKNNSDKLLTGEKHYFLFVICYASIYDSEVTFSKLLQYSTTSFKYFYEFQTKYSHELKFWQKFNLRVFRKEIIIIKNYIRLFYAKML